MIVYPYLHFCPPNTFHINFIFNFFINQFSNVIEFRNEFLVEHHFIISKATAGTSLNVPVVCDRSVVSWET